MLVGILVGVVQTVSTLEREHTEVRWVATNIKEMLRAHDMLGNGSGFGKAQFQWLLSNPSAAAALVGIGIDVVGLVDLMDFIFPEDEDAELPFGEFIETI